MDRSTLITGAVIALTFGATLIAEWLAPLRPPVEPKLRRIVRNLTTGGVSLAVMTLLQAPLLTPVAAWVARENVGLLHAVELPRVVEIAIALLLLDYTLWIWHWLNHKVPVLWRFHLVHHVDRDLDSSTALRFHFGELTLSVLYRAVQIMAIGVDVYALWIWQTILFASILFHHSNVRLPFRFERAVVWFLVTPRMHGIHHSDVESETNSNWSSLFTIWDVVHRTFRFDVPQERIRIGVPAYGRPADVTIGKILALPFRRQRDDWTPTEP